MHTVTSAQPCGCDPGLRVGDSFWRCKRYPDCPWGHALLDIPASVTHTHIGAMPISSLTTTVGDLPVVDEKAYRKARPVYSGVLSYFPDALLAVANISHIGNEQHNPGQPLHWARHKSTDQMDAAVRHILDHAKGISVDTDGGYHLAKAAWRLLAELQLLIEKQAAEGSRPCGLA